MKINGLHLLILIIIIIIIVLFYYNFYSKKYYQYNPSIEEYITYYINLLNEDKNIDNSKLVSNVVFLYSYDYDKVPAYKEHSYNLVKKYCDNYGYILEDINHNTDVNKISPYWIRVADLLLLSKKYDSNTVFIYLDIDILLKIIDFFLIH